MLYFNIFIDYTLIAIFPVLPEILNDDVVKLNVTIPVLVPMVNTFVSPDN
jgi:hypothetical protein